MKSCLWGALAIALVSLAQPAAAQQQARMELTKFHSRAMEGNLEGNSADRDVYVVTPPGYDENPTRHYPVVYFLHGYFATPQMYQETMHFDQVVQEAAEAGNEVIMVIPDGYSKLKGGFYSSGPVAGDYESMVADDLVAWVDANYRSIPDVDSRGLSGHSMGGYGTIRIAMKHPGVFSSIYMMSACCLDPMLMTAEDAAAINALTDGEIDGAQFGALAAASRGSVWAPDPTADNAMHIDTRLGEDGEPLPLVQYRLASNSPVVMVPQHVRALNGLEALAIDIGDADRLLVGNRQLMAEFDRFGVKYEFELYEGDHGNRIAERIRTDVLPFFGSHLDRE